jgi:hypothetical protein
MDLTYSVGQGADNLGPHKVEQPHCVRSNTARRAPQRAPCLAVNQFEKLARCSSSDKLHGQVVVKELEHQRVAKALYVKVAHRVSCSL